jgi:hypothetical protein
MQYLGRTTYLALQGEVVDSSLSQLHLRKKSTSPLKIEI